MQDFIIVFLDYLGVQLVFLATLSIWSGEQLSLFSLDVGVSQNMRFSVVKLGESQKMRIVCHPVFMPKTIF